MKRYISISSAAVLLAGAMLAPAMLRADDKDAKPEARQEGERGGKHGGKHGMGLELTDEQEAKLKTLRRANREAAESARAEMGAVIRKLKDQLEDKAPEKELSATLDKIQAAHKAMQAQQEKFEADMRALLTPTQRAKMVVGMMGHGRFGMGGGHPPRAHEERGEERQEDRAQEHDED